MVESSSMASVSGEIAVAAEHGCMILATGVAPHRSRGTALMSFMLTQPIRRPVSTTGNILRWDR
jgi:hypothetical protein